MLGKQSFFCFLKTKMRRRCEKNDWGSVKRKTLAVVVKKLGARDKHSVIPGGGMISRASKNLFFVCVDLFFAVLASTADRSDTKDCRWRKA